MQLEHRVLFDSETPGKQASCRLMGKDENDGKVDRKIQCRQVFEKRIFEKFKRKVDRKYSVD